MSSFSHSKLRTRNSKLRILDIGTGSGTIILSLAKANSLCHPELTKGLGLDSSCGQNDKGSKVRFFASDVSHDALKLARKNAKSNGLNELIEFKEGDLFVPWQGQKFDIIVANLPYIPHEDMATLAFDLVHYEPRLALDGGVKGMDIYERFLPELPLYLKEEATAFLEIGYNQGPLITKIVQKVMPKARVEVLGDYANIDRIVVIKT